MNLAFSRHDFLLRERLLVTDGNTQDILSVDWHIRFLCLEDVFTINFNAPDYFHPVLVRGKMGIIKLEGIIEL